MFDTMKIAGVIKQARIDRNMTQMQLADAMGVSYQAVSNWERGNSMPDISKLEDLCRTLEITVEQLLGMEPRTTDAVTKVMAEEKLTVEELTEVAPMLPPKELKKQIKAEKKRRKLKLEAIVDLAPFLGEEDLEELLNDMELTDLDDLDGLEELAPFMGREALNRLVERLSMEQVERIGDIAPFLSRETLNRLVDRMIAEGYDPEEYDHSDLYPFLSKEATRKLSRYLLERRDLEALEDLMPFV